MIACWHSWAGAPPPRTLIASALARYRGRADQTSHASTHFQWLNSAGQSFGEFGPVRALVHGWIDKASEIASELGLERNNPGAAYAGAIARWREDADKHLAGNYAAIALLPDGRLRLSRSPWAAPPLYYHASQERIIASPLHRVLFAGGAPRELDYDRIIDELAYDFRDGEETGWYKDICQVPLGCAAIIGEEKRELNRWYSVENLPKIGLGRDDEYPEAANALLDEAGRKVMASCEKPAMALSGGLDSPLAADALTRAIPGDRRLDAITFVPHPDWDGIEPSGLIGNEAALARRFADFNGRIDLHIADPEQGGFDFRSKDMFQAMEIYAPGLANVGVMHGVWSKARELGCDMLVDAELGNLTFSDNGRWAYVQYARERKWGELLALLRNRPGDKRSFVRKALALSILPQLPSAIRSALRAAIHPQRRDMTGLLTLLSDDVRLAHRSRSERAGRQRAWDDLTHPRSRREAIQQYAILGNGPAADTQLAFEQIYGIRHRDLTAYRPLVEFCLGLPSEQFASQGTERRLARGMAKGRLPEAHRLETRHGQHNIDWHARMTPRRGEMLRYAEAMRGHPWLAQTVDVDRISDLIERWPDAPSYTWEGDLPLQLGLPRIILAAQFIGIVEGRNDL